MHHIASGPGQGPPARGTVHSPQDLCAPGLAGLLLWTAPPDPRSDSPPTLSSDGPPQSAQMAPHTQLRWPPNALFRWPPTPSPVMFPHMLQTECPHALPWPPVVGFQNLSAVLINKLLLPPVQKLCTHQLSWERTGFKKNQGKGKVSMLSWGQILPTRLTLRPAWCWEPRQPRVLLCVTWKPDGSGWGPWCFSGTHRRDPFWPIS